jgi:hypothetical protein
MVKSCCAVGRSTKGNTLSFCRFPADTERRRLWISAINRKGWEPNEYSYVCSAHFVSGKKSNDVLSPDYVPSIFHHVSSPLKRQKEADLHAYHRRKQANRARLETALRQEEEQARGNAGRKKASIEQEAREDTEQGTMAMESSGSSSLSVATQTDLSAEEVGYMEKRAREVRVVQENVLTRDRQLSRVRIHVERVIGVLRQKYTILQSILPINMIMCDDTTETSMIDKIVVICCALCNLCDPVVPLM